MGVSTPFQLHPVGSLGVNNVCGVDDGEDGMVVVCSNESVLHDKINMVGDWCHSLKTIVLNLLRTGVMTNVTAPIRPKR